MKTISVRKFELNPTVRRFTEVQDHKKVLVVIQTKTKVIQQIKGYEAFVLPYLWNNMTKSQFALVFDSDTNRLLGYISKNEFDIPTRYSEPEELYFNDMYERVSE